MQYARMGHLREREIGVPELSGGINAERNMSRMEDNELFDVKNMWFEDGVLCTRPPLYVTDVESESHTHAGMNLTGRSAVFYYAGKKACALTYYCWPGEHIIYVVSLDGELLHRYRFDCTDSAAAVAPVSEDRYGVPFFVFIDGRVYKPIGDTLVEHTADVYIPMIFVNGRGYHWSEADTGSGRFPVNGTMLEGYNALSARYKCRYTSEDGKHIYPLPKPIAAGSVVSLSVVLPSGEYSASAKTGETATITQGSYTYRFTPAAGASHISVTWTKSGASGAEASGYGFPTGSVSSNITIEAEYEKTAEEKAYLRGATAACWFGGTSNERGGTRLFLSGFSSDGNQAKVVWSDADEPLYFSENNYCYIGDASRRVTALHTQSDRLIIFKESETYCMRYAQGTVDADAVSEGLNTDVSVSAAAFPVTQISPNIGCDCPDTVVLCQNRLVWMNADGEMNTLVMNEPYSDSNIRSFGSKITPKILRDSTKSERRAAHAVRYKNRYVVFVGSKAYLFSYQDYGFIYLSGYYSAKYDKKIAWFVWELENTEGDRLVPLSDGDELTLCCAVKGEAAQAENPPYRLCVRSTRHEAYRMSDSGLSLLGRLTITGSSACEVAENDEQALSFSFSASSDGVFEKSVTFDVNDCEIDVQAFPYLHYVYETGDDYVYETGDEETAPVKLVCETEDLAYHTAAFTGGTDGYISTQQLFGQYRGKKKMAQLTVCIRGVRDVKVRFTKLCFAKKEPDENAAPLSDGTKDEMYAFENGEYVRAVKPIRSLLDTKRYDFGNIAAYKRIKALYLSGETKDTAWLTQITEAGEERHPIPVAMRENETRMVLCNIPRCRYYGVRIESEAPFRIGGIQLRFELYGTVR